MKENLASEKVLRKLDFKEGGKCQLYGLQLKTFKKNLQAASSITELLTDFIFFIT